MKYAIIASVGLVELHKDVTDYINSGWEPLGGIASDGNRVLQAMVKRETIKATSAEDLPF